MFWCSGRVGSICALSKQHKNHPTNIPRSNYNNIVTQSAWCIRLLRVVHPRHRSLPKDSQAARGVDRYNPIPYCRRWWQYLGLCLNVVGSILTDRNNALFPEFPSEKWSSKLVRHRKTPIERWDIRHSESADKTRLCTDTMQSVGFASGTECRGPWASQKCTSCSLYIWENLEESAIKGQIGKSIGYVPFLVNLSGLIVHAIALSTICLFSRIYCGALSGDTMLSSPFWPPHHHISDIWVCPPNIYIFYLSATLGVFVRLRYTVSTSYG